jgi:hypothetical protein
MVASFQVKTEDEDTSYNSAFENFQNKNCPPMSLVLCKRPPSFNLSYILSSINEEHLNYPRNLFVLV